MIVDKVKNVKNGGHLSLKLKLTLSLCAIALILLLSSVISVIQFRNMNNYVSGLIAENISNINVARKMADSINEYNLDILAVIGDDKLNRLPDFDQAAFMASCDSLKDALANVSKLPLADSVVYSYSAYMLTSLELTDVILSTFIDSRTWYFERLQPRYNKVRSDIDAMSTAVYDDLKKNSSTFDRGFYRSVIPGIVAVGVGLLLILMLLFFILVYYINPLYRMLSGLENYQSFNKKYNVDFEGDDQLRELNDGIAELANENQQLKKRINLLRNERQGDN